MSGSGLIDLRCGQGYVPFSSQSAFFMGSKSRQQRIRDEKQDEEIEARVLKDQGEGLGTRGRTKHAEP